MPYTIRSVLIAISRFRFTEGKTRSIAAWNVTETEGESTMEMNERESTSRTIKLPLGQKYMLTLREASAYFNIGEKKIRRLAEDHQGELSIFSGNKYLIIRPKFEQFLAETSTL